MRADDPFLAGILESLRKRSKALRHKNWRAQVDRVIVVDAGQSTEQLEVSFAKHPHQRFAVTVSTDRRIWLTACEAIRNAGWKFEFHDQGRLTGEVDGRRLVELIEESLARMFGMHAGNTQRLAQIWSGSLAKGPQGIS